ncbi:MAG: Ig-like domain repeat protein, partial [Candidatus Poribacteria bacterium]
MSVEAIAIADKSPPAIENIAAVPDPFSPNNDGVDEITTVSFTLTEETFVTLNLYPTSEGDVPILDAPVITLISEVLPAGDNRVSWDGRDDTGELIDEGVYVYRFEKTMTLDASGNTLLQEISGSVTDILTPPLEIKVLEAQPQPFSPDGDSVNDIIHLNYTLSDFADFVAVNIIDSSTGEPKIITSLKAEAFEYFFDGRNWISVHFPNGIPPGRSDENYYLAPVDTQNGTPPPFGLLDKPQDAQTINGYLVNYQANNLNWKPVPFDISWNGGGATESGAYVYHISASQTNGVSAVPKTGVILIESIVVVPDDKTPPIVERTQPPEESIHSAQLALVSADLDDLHGTGADLTASTIRLIGSSGTIPGRQSNDGINTITWTLSEPLADDGSEDGPYTIIVSPVDFAKNRPLAPLVFSFQYNSTLSDETLPDVVDNSESPLVLLNTNRAIKLEASEETLVKLEDGEQIDSIQVTINDTGSGIDLAASSLQVLTSPGEALVTAEKRQAPVSRFSGKLILRKIAIQFDGTYVLSIQPIDNAGNTGDVKQYFFRYKTVDDLQPPTIDNFQFSADDFESSVPLTENLVHAASITGFSVSAQDPSPSVGFSLNPASSTIRLINASGESVPGDIFYSNQTTAPDGTVLVNIQLTLNTPLAIDGSDDGDYIVEAIVEDNSGNVSDLQTVSFKYDTIPPTAIQLSIDEQQLSIDDNQLALVSSLPQKVSAVLTDTPNGSGIAVPSDAGDLLTTSQLFLLAPDGNRVPARAPTESEIQGELVEIYFEPDPIADPDGVYTVVAIPFDQGGVAGAKVEGRFLLDKSPPEVTGMRIEKTTVPLDEEVFVTGEVNEIQLTLKDVNGINIQNASTAFELLPPPESIAPERPLEGTLSVVSLQAVPQESSSTPEELTVQEELLVFRLTVPLSINGVYTIRGQIADNAGNVRQLETIVPALRFTYDNRPPSIEGLSVVDEGTGGLIALENGKLITQTFSAVVASVTDITSGMAWGNTRLVLKDESGTLVPRSE